MKQEDTTIGFRNRFRVDRSKRLGYIVVASDESLVNRNKEMDVDHSTELQQPQQLGETKNVFNENNKNRFQFSMNGDFMMKWIMNYISMSSTKEESKKEVSYNA